MKILNFFVRSKIFDQLNKFFARKIFKLFKVFFVETNIKDLPKNNYPLVNIDKDLFHSKFFSNNKALPYISYSHLAHLLQIIIDKKKNLVFYDYGAGNLNLYYYLNNKFKNFFYIFKDQAIIEEKVEIIKKIEKIDNLYTSSNKENFFIDILYFGSSLQYMRDYKEELGAFFNQTKYILISQSPFFQNNKIGEKVILKQINMHPLINYLYLFNLDSFTKFMDENNYELVEKNINKVTKFLNFKNFDKQKYKNINMYDLLFKLKDEKK